MTGKGVLRGQLCIWTDVDPAFEDDFNRWYDREHMQERVAIPGFQSARRFLAIGASSRPYLALYYTDSLDVFRSPEYRNAFSNQTPWSLQNFSRMRNTRRRVGELVIETGGGEGGALALFLAPPAEPSAPDTLRGLLAQAAEQDHIVCASALKADTALSTPLDAGAEPPPDGPLVFVEATRVDAAVDAARRIADALASDEPEVHGFQLLWRLDRQASQELPSER